MNRASVNIEMQMSHPHTVSSGYMGILPKVPRKIIKREFCFGIEDFVIHAYERGLGKFLQG